MCDTIVALGAATGDGSVLFGKNSDREPDECQNVEIREVSLHDDGERVSATYIEVPRATRTNRVLLCQPFWMFGAEMGANEHGVAIGNEALFTREKPSRRGLTGMDLLRLALERSDSAQAALEMIISLLEEHGQGGKCGYRHKLGYMNGFLIADRGEAYVLETVHSWWAYKRVHDYWSISNIISLTDDFDECSPGLVEHAVKKGWCGGEDDFNFRACYSDFLYTRFALGEDRECRSRALLKDKAGGLGISDVMEILRDHGGREDFAPDRQRGGSVCMHAANPLTRPSQSVCSLVARLADSGDGFYATASANPCMSPFFPVFAPGTGMPAGYRPGAAAYDPSSYWWESERLHRLALPRFGRALDSMRPRLEAYEREMLAEVESGGQTDQAAVDRFFEKARGLVRRWGAEMEKLPARRLGPVSRFYWSRLNRLDGIEP